MTVQTLAAELGIDIADVGVAVRWLTAGEVLDEAALELELHGIFDPAGQRTARDRAACPECGRLPGPNLVLLGWHPCRCGGHSADPEVIEAVTAARSGGRPCGEDDGGRVVARIRAVQVVRIDRIGAQAYTGFVTDL